MYLRERALSYVYIPIMVAEGSCIQDSSASHSDHDVTQSTDGVLDLPSGSSVEYSDGRFNSTTFPVTDTMSNLSVSQHADLYAEQHARSLPHSGSVDSGRQRSDDDSVSCRPGR